MTDALGIVGSTQTITPPSGAVVSGTSAVTPISADDNKPLAQSSTAGISPRIVVDPLAGVITEFLNSTGQIQSQIPSTAVVAYLRAGLEADGHSKPNPSEGPQKQSASAVA